MAALDYNHSRALRMYGWFHEIIYIRAHILTKLFSAYIAILLFWLAFRYKDVYKGFFIFWWNLIIWSYFLYPLFNIDCYFVKIGPAEKWLTIVWNIPWTLWCIIGLYQVIRKVKFTNWIWWIHTVCFILFWVWNVWFVHLRFLNPIDRRILRLGHVLGLF
ncbi:MAG: hypothetical protein J6U96_02790 [Elusimicrobiaceae bacterium]|nr:hypothetical protein [Elusimicrobiaceae bacterium]